MCLPVNNVINQKRKGRTNDSKICRSKTKDFLFATPEPISGHLNVFSTIPTAPLRRTVRNNFFFLLQDIRKVVQTLEQTAREILTVLQSVHQPSGFKESKGLSSVKGFL